MRRRNLCRRPTLRLLGTELADGLEMIKFIYGMVVGVALAFTMIFALNANSAKSVGTTDSKIIVGQ